MPGGAKLAEVPCTVRLAVAEDGLRAGRRAGARHWRNCLITLLSMVRRPARH